MDSILKNLIEETKSEQRAKSAEYEIVGIRPSEEIFNMIDVLSVLNKKSFTTFFSNKISEKTAICFSSLMKTQEGIDLYCDIAEKIEDSFSHTAFNIISVKTTKKDPATIPADKVALISTYKDYEDWEI